ncbi:MAG: FAD:protein FMN transferase [Rudaea sp.]
MPVTVEIVDRSATLADVDSVFAYFDSVDNRFSTYKADSEISAINRGALALRDASDDMRLVFALAEQTRLETNGYFDISHNGGYDPSGIVKGWAIYNAARMLRDRGFSNYQVEAGGDLQASGMSERGQAWLVGIRNPFNPREIVKVLRADDCGIATSGTYVRGQHVYNPKVDSGPIKEVVSLTVVGPNIYEADRFATAAFAMGRDGIRFIDQAEGLEGYMIDDRGRATMTRGLTRYVDQ